MAVYGTLELKSYFYVTFIVSSQYLVFVCFFNVSIWLFSKPYFFFSVFQKDFPVEL